MIKRTSKYLGWFLLSTFVAVLLYLTCTYSGLKFITQMLERIMPNELQIQMQSGALIRTIQIKSFNLNTRDIHIQANNVKFHINFFALILNDLNIDRFHADKLHIHIKEAQHSPNTSAPGFSLPVKIHLQNTSITQFIYQDGKQSYHLNNLNLDTKVRTNEIKIDALNTVYQHVNYAISGHFNLSPVQLHLVLNRQQEKQKPLDIMLNANGSWQHIKFSAQAKSPVAIKVQGEISDLLTSPKWKMQGNSSQLFLDKEMNTYSAQFSGTGDAKKLLVNAKLKPIKSRADTLISLRLQSDDLSKEQIKAYLSWQDLFWPKRKNHQLVSPSGNLTISGSVNHYLFNGDLTVRGKDVPSTDLSISGEGNKSSLNFKTINLNLLNGVVSGAGTVNWQQHLNYHFKLNARDLQPNRFWVNFPGDINFDIDLKTHNNQTRAVLADINGVVRSKSIGGFANFSLNHYQLKTGILKVHTDDSHVYADFNAEKHMKMNWDINITDLEELTPFAQGTIISKASIRKEQNGYQLQGTTSVDGLQWQTISLDSLNADFSLSSNPDKSSVANIDATDLSYKNYYLKRIHFDTKGKNPTHEIYIVINNNDNLIDTKMVADYNANLSKWLVKVSRLNLVSTQSGRWHLQQPFTLRHTNQSTHLEKFDWRSANQRVHIQRLTIVNNILNTANFKIKNLSLATFNSFFPNNVNVAGKLNMQGNYLNKKSVANAQFKLDLKKARITYPENESTETIAFSEANIDTSIDNNLLQSHLKIMLQKNDYLDYSVNIDKFDPVHIINDQQMVKMQLKAQLHSLDIVKPFISANENISGQFNADLTWNGTFANPAISGIAAISKAKLQIAKQGLNLTNMNAKLTGEGSKINYLFSADSGKGNMKITGQTLLNKNYETLLDITGNNFEIDRTPHFHIIVSPKLKVKIANEALHITGDLLIPMTHIDLMSYANVETLSSDVKIIKASGTQSNATLLDNLYANINLILGDDISLKTKFLTAQLAGKLQLNDTPSTETTANGELTITKGTVSAFGQSLTITNGKLLYAGGPTTDPGLNIKAYKEIRTFVNPAEGSVTQNTLASSGSSGAAQTINAPLQQKMINVGIDVTNTLSDPHFILYSDQANLSQADILSYLILGYPMSQASGSQGEALIQAANALSASNNDMSGLISNIKDTLNINEIGLQTNNYLNTANNSVEQNTSLVLGKMLSPRLFVHYSIGLIVPINTLSATYAFDRNWSLQTETNSLGNGVDLIYTWQRD